MRSVRFLMLAVTVLLSATLFAQATKTEQIKVWGNCAVCKKHIEKASKTDGVTSATWNTKTKFLTITYDPAKISNDQIQKNVSAVGYDTEKYKGDDKAYNDLDACCQYDRKPTDKKHK